MNTSSILHALFGTRKSPQITTAKTASGSASSFFSVLKERAQQLLQGSTDSRKTESATGESTPAKALFGLNKTVKTPAQTVAAPVSSATAKETRELPVKPGDAERKPAAEVIIKQTVSQPQPQAPAIFSPIIAQATAPKADVPAAATKKTSAATPAPNPGTQNSVNSPLTIPAAAGGNQTTVKASTQKAEPSARVTPSPFSVRSETPASVARTVSTQGREVDSTPAKAARPQAVSDVRQSANGVAHQQNTARVTEKPRVTAGGQNTTASSAPQDRITSATRQDTTRTATVPGTATARTESVVSKPVVEPSGARQTVNGEFTSLPKAAAPVSTDMPRVRYTDTPVASGPAPHAGQSPVSNPAPRAEQASSRPKTAAVNNPVQTPVSEKPAAMSPAPRTTAAPASPGVAAVKTEIYVANQAAPKAATTINIPSIQAESARASAPTPASVQTKSADTAQSTQRLNILQQIQSFWTRHISGTGTETGTPTAKPQVQAAISKNAETIPEGRIAQIRESFRNWERRTSVNATTESPAKSAQVVSSANSTVSRQPQAATSVSNATQPTLAPVANVPTRTVTAADSATSKVKLTAEQPLARTTTTVNTTTDSSVNRPVVVPLAKPVASNREALRAPVSHLDQPAEIKTNRPQVNKAESSARPAIQTVSTTETVASPRPGGTATPPTAENPVRATEKQTESVLKSLWGFRIGSREKTTSTAQPVEKASASTAETSGKTITTAPVREVPVTPVVQRSSIVVDTTTTAVRQPSVVAATKNTTPAIASVPQTPVIASASAAPITVAAAVPKTISRETPSASARLDGAQVSSRERPAKSETSRINMSRDAEPSRFDVKPVVTARPAEAPRESVLNRTVETYPVPETALPKTNTIPVDNNPAANRRETLKSSPSDIPRQNYTSVNSEQKSTIGSVVKERPVETVAAPNYTSAAPRQAETSVANPVIAPPTQDVAPRSSQTSAKAPTHQTEAVRETAAQTATNGSESGQTGQATVAAENRETSQASPVTAQFSRIKFTTEQIKELQALVSKAMQNARVSVTGTNEATFNWNIENIGAVRFHITSNQDDVKIEISSTRQDVVDALEDGKGVMERMITDLGLRVEKFDVKIENGGRESDWMNQARERGEHSHRQTEAEPDFASSGSATSEPAAVAEPQVRRMPANADHEWVA
jgi:hypothetical protein